MRSIPSYEGVPNQGQFYLEYEKGWTPAERLLANIVELIKRPWVTVKIRFAEVVNYRTYLELFAFDEAYLIVWCENENFVVAEGKRSLELARQHLTKVSEVIDRVEKWIEPKPMPGKEQQEEFLRGFSENHEKGA